MPGGQAGDWTPITDPRGHRMQLWTVEPGITGPAAGKGTSDTVQDEPGSARGMCSYVDFKKTIGARTGCSPKGSMNINGFDKTENA